MPGHRVHAYADREFFGRTFWKIHRKMDEPVMFLGKSHRVLFHDFGWAIAIADYCYPSDVNARSAALLHLQLDDVCSYDPVFKKQLEFLAEMDARKRKKLRKAKRKRKNKKDFLLSPQEIQLKKDLKNMLKIQRLTSLLRS